MYICIYIELGDNTYPADLRVRLSARLCLQVCAWQLVVLGLYRSMCMCPPCYITDIAVIETTEIGCVYI